MESSHARQKLKMKHIIDTIEEKGSGKNRKIEKSNNPCPSSGEATNGKKWVVHGAIDKRGREGPN